MLERRLLCALHPLEWFLKAAGVEKERPQQQTIVGSIDVKVHDNDGSTRISSQDSMEKK